MRFANKPGDAVLSMDGTAKVNRKNVGFWERRCLIENDTARHYYFFFLAKGEAPALMEYYCHEFRAAIPFYLSRRGDPSFVSEAKQEMIAAKYAASTPGATWPTIPRPAPTEAEAEMHKERKARGGRFSHVTRGIRSGEPLKGKTRELALELVDARGDDEHSIFLRKIGDKIEADLPLDNYEKHIMIDMVLLHSRLGG